MNLFQNRMKRKWCSLILIVAIFVTSVYKNELFAENKMSNIEILPASLQTQELDMQVKGHALSGKHEFENIKIADYTDAILLSLDDNTNILAEEAFAGENFENVTSLYGSQYVVKAENSLLRHSIVMENDIKFISQSMVAGEDTGYLYSKHGNIDLQSNQITYRGIIYAPEGTITLSGNNIQIDGAMVAKKIIIQAESFNMNGFTDTDMKKLEWIHTSPINSDFVSIDEEKKQITMNLGDSQETELYIRKSSQAEFQLLDITHEKVYQISFDTIEGNVDFRTSAKKFGETTLSPIITLNNTGKTVEETTLDTDGDGVPDGYEIWNLKTNPNQADTDNDGFPDGYEVFVLGSNPLSATANQDSDSDGWFDRAEMEAGTHPFLPDTDFDGFLDSTDINPLITDVESGLQPDYNVVVPMGAFDINERYYEENGQEFETIFNYVNGHNAYMKKDGKETYNYFDVNGNTVASIVKAEEETTLNTFSYDENGNKTSMTHNGMLYNYSYDENGNVLNANLGDQTLELNSYEGDKLLETSYGNGDWEKNEYDSNGNLIKTTLNGELAYEWKYGDSEDPHTYVDHVNQKTYNYEYDEEGRLIKTTSSDGLSIEYIENEGSLKTVYHYGEDAIEKTIDIREETEDSLDVAVNYGEETYVTTLENGILDMHFETAEENTVAQSEFEISQADGTVETERSQEGQIEYQYDDNNNIIEKKVNGTIEATYEYDSLNQVVRENSVETETTAVYEYDNVGNIIGTEKHDLDFDTPTDALGSGEDIEYSYEDDNWKDQLTSYNGQEILYDEIGNPISYYNGMKFDWSGKKLVAIQNGDQQITYTYSAEGYRTSKTANGIQTVFLWDDDTLIGEKRVDGTIWYMHDNNQMIAGFQFNDNAYYFDKNLQGDVCGILNQDGDRLVEYKYDAWGNVISITGDEELGNFNPIRYRGYYQDNETGFYYLQSRYYDSETKRFLNADEDFDLGAEHAWGNLYTYTGNNSVMRVDYNGNSYTSVLLWIGLVVVALVIYVVTTSTLLRNWFQNADKIKASMYSAFNRAGFSYAFSTTKSMVDVLWIQLERSFAKAKKTYSTKERHHICAKGSTKAIQARNALDGCGLNVEHSRNIISIKKGLHKRIHTDLYYKITNEMVCRANALGKTITAKKNNILSVLDILKGTLKALERIAPF